MFSVLDKVAPCQRIGVTLIGLLAFIGSAAVGLLAGIAEPEVHDEFSYLLAADTFAHGRLTNPTHPMWIHFESFHIIHQPTYMSKYPPAQGLILAAGQLIGGRPIIGVWLSFALMCAAICWMLYAWVTPRWAIFGGVLAVINPVLGIAGYWAQSYWGGAVAAIGGALVVGGMRRVMREPRVHHSLITAAGLGILANSRPFEGLLVSIPTGIFLCTHIFSQRGELLRFSFRRILIPILLVLALTIAAMGFYNLRVTGDILRVPYQIHEKSYAMTPLFVWQELPPKAEYRHEIIRDFHATHALPFYTNQRSIAGFLSKNLSLLLLMGFLTLNIFLIPMMFNFSVFARWTSRDRWARRAFIICSVLVFGLLTEIFKMLHYLAPIAAINYYFVVNALRLGRWRSRRIGQLTLRLMLIVSIIWLGTSLYEVTRKGTSSSWHIQRAQLLQQLMRKDGQHLVIVSYGLDHSFHNEWVYNEADIDLAKVVWARDIDHDQNCKLVKYFRDRNIWSLEVEGKHSVAKLKPYMNLCSEYLHKNSRPLSS